MFSRWLLPIFILLLVAPSWARGTKNLSRGSSRDSALLLRPRDTGQKIPLITWKDYQQLSQAQRAQLVMSLKGVYRDVDARNKKAFNPSSPAQKFLTEWAQADESVYKDNKRLLTFDSNVMVARHFCDKQAKQPRVKPKADQPSSSCGSLMKISKEVAQAKNEKAR
jgi:hypothetical protein